MQKIFEKKLVIIAMMSVPGPFNGYHKMRHNSAFTGQKQLEFWNKKGEQIFSCGSLKILVLTLTFLIRDSLL